MADGRPSAPVTLYFDGLCPLCSREIAYYRKRAAGDLLRFVDITAPEFNAAEFGLDRKRVHQVMHVKVGDEVRVGLDAFIAVWQAIPAYRRLARAASLPGLHFILTIGYDAFAVMRTWLPRLKRPICEAGSCTQP